MNKTLTINIDKQITERDFMEDCLNLHYSGYDTRFVIGIYGLVKGLNISKIIYLRGLMRDNK